MKIYRLLIVIALAILSVAGVQAQQTYNDTVRTKTWTLYVAGGVSGYRGLRGGSETGVLRSIVPDLSLGLKYNINPGVRVGLNFGYTMIKAKNAGIAYSQTVTEGYHIGGYDDAILTVDKAVMINRIDNHLAGVDLNFDINLLSGLDRQNERLNLWLGSGVGYYYGWNRHTITTAVREEAVSNTDDHFNIYSNDYIATDVANTRIHALYIPVRLSVEYDVSQRWTVGMKAEGRYMPLIWRYTAKGIWSANLTLAYNFVAKRYSRQTIEERYEGRISRLNKNIRELKDEVSTLTQKNKVIAEAKAKQEKEAEALRGVEDARNRREEIQEQEAVRRIVKNQPATEHISSLAVVGKILVDNPKAKVYIKVNSPANGRNDYGKKLAELRLKDITDILIQKFKVDPKRVITDGNVPTGSNCKVYEYNNLASLTVEM